MEKGRRHAAIAWVKPTGGRISTKCQVVVRGAERMTRAFRGAHGNTPRGGPSPNAFSKKSRITRQAVALYFMQYNFGRVYQTLRVTPAQEAGCQSCLEH